MLVVAMTFSVYPQFQKGVQKRFSTSRGRV